MSGSFASGLSLQQIDNNSFSVSGMNETNILISGNFSTNTRINPNFISLLSGTQNIEITYDKSKPYGDVGTITAKSDNSTNSTAFNITVPKNISFSLSQTSFQTNSSASESGALSFYMENTGNSEANITANLTGNFSQFLYLEKSLILGNDRKLYQVNYSAPNATGKYYSALNLSSGSFTRLVNLSFIVTDSESPKITNWTFEPEMKIGKKYWIKFKASDNINISRAEVVIDTFNASVNLTEGQYSTEFTPKNYGYFSVTMTVSDFSGNKASESGQVHVVPINGTDVFRINNNIDFGTRVYNSTSLRNIFFRTDEPLNFSVNRSSFSISNMQFRGINQSENPSIMLLYGDSSIDFGNFTYLELNDFSGGLAIDVSPNGWTFDYSGGLKLNLPSSYEYDKSISFKGAFSNYTVCNGGEYFGFLAFPFSFRPYDTGNYDTSYCEAISKYPIDFDPKKAFVLSPSEREQIFAQQNQQIVFWQSQSAGAWNIIYIFIIGIAITLSGVGYFKCIYPNQG